MSTIFIFLIVLSILVLVHELGHFLVARAFGVRVDEFGFGFPPRAFGIQKGKTLYSINWIPLGGFVKLKGEGGEQSHDKDSFAGKPLWQRALVIAAGVIMNVLLAWSLFTLGYMIGIPQVAEDLPAHARVRDVKVQVLSVLEDSAASKAGVLEGDVIVSIDGVAVTTMEEVRAMTGSHEGVEVRAVLRRGSETLEKTLVPTMLKEAGRAGVGVALVRTGLVTYPFYIAPLQGFMATWYYGGQIFSAFGGIFTSLFSAHRPDVELSGPVGIAVMTSEVARLGFVYLVQFTAILSLNLAVLNVLPIPALDGGRLAFLLVERLRGKAAGMKFEQAVHSIGYILLLTLVAVATYYDVAKFGGRIADGLKRLVWGA